MSEVRCVKRLSKCGDSLNTVVLLHKTADSTFYLLLSVLLLLGHMTETLSYGSPFSLTFLLSLLRTHCSLLLDCPLLLRAIVLVTYCSRDSIVLVTSIVHVTLLFSVSI